MDLGIIVITLVILFLLYRIGAIRFAQSSTEIGIRMSERLLSTMDEEGEEKHSRKLGKLYAKYDDESIKRATLAELKARRQNFNKQPSVKQSPVKKQNQTPCSSSGV